MSGPRPGRTHLDHRREPPVRNSALVQLGVLPLHARPSLLPLLDLQPGLRLRDPKSGTTVPALNTHDAIEKVAGLRPEVAAALGLHSGGGQDEEGKKRQAGMKRDDPELYKSTVPHWWRWSRCVRPGLGPDIDRFHPPNTTSAPATPSTHTTHPRPTPHASPPPTRQ